MKYVYLLTENSLAKVGVLRKLFSNIIVTLLWLLTRVSLGMVLWCFSPLFSVFSNPSWSRRMATAPESGSARGFFLLKGSRSFLQSLQAISGREIGLKFRYNLLVSFARILFLNWLYMNELDYFEIN